MVLYEENLRKISQLL